MPAPPNWLGLWSQPRSTLEWAAFLLQWLAPIGFVAVCVAALNSWESGTNSINDGLFRVFSVVAALAALAVWLAALLLPRLRGGLPNQWQQIAAGCLVLPSVVIMLLVLAFIAVPLIDRLGKLAFAPFLACIGGLLPLGALLFVLRRK